jgi:hypothetical protein
MPHSIGVQVVADGLTARETECLERAISAVNGLQSQFLVRDGIRKIALPGKRNLLKEDASFDALLRRAKKDRMFCVTPRSFSGNEFQLADERCSLLTIDDWEEKYAPPSLQTYIVYQFAFAFLTWAADHVSDKVLTHKKTIGCRMDYCRNKRELKLGMLAGYICPKCKGHLRQLDAAPAQVNAIERILNYVQAASKGEDRVSEDWNSAFVVMRFSEDDENQAAFERGIKPGLRDVGIIARRADDFIESRPLLEKITGQILNSRFIVAKVDAKRLNIYYELGLAMGHRKDVLLISEEKWTNRLPSDLSNWECLTYPKGDYAALRRKIAKFYRDNYARV